MRYLSVNRQEFAVNGDGVVADHGVQGEGAVRVEIALLAGEEQGDAQSAFLHEGFAGGKVDAAAGE